MSLVRWSPFFDSFDDIDELMNRFPLMAGKSSPANTALIPAIDIYEKGDNLVVETPLAGIAPEDVTVSIEKGVLTISGERKKEHEVDDKNYYRKEVRTGTFSRQITLPSTVEENNISAEFVDGVLKITCPKTKPSEAKKVTIDIKKSN